MKPLECTGIVLRECVKCKQEKSEGRTEAKHIFQQKGMRILGSMVIVRKYQMSKNQRTTREGRQGEFQEQNDKKMPSEKVGKMKC